MAIDGIFYIKNRLYLQQENQVNNTNHPPQPMPSPTVLFLGHHVPLLLMLRDQINGKFRVEQVSQPLSTKHPYNLQDVSMIVMQHDPAHVDVLPEVRQFHRDVPNVPGCYSDLQR